LRVPLLDLVAQYETSRGQTPPRLLRICAEQAFVLGPEVAGFEEEIAAYVRAPHAIACASGTDALLLPLMARDIGPGDEVITPSFTFMATAEAVALRGARPVFVDVEPGTFNLDPERLEAAITPRTRAIIAVDLFGQCAAMQPILEIARRHGLFVVEDAAQSIGAEHHGRRAGEMAEFTTFSFYPSKNLGAFGDAGLVTTLDADAAARMRQLRVHGEASRYIHAHVGTNSRLDALQAAVLRVKLRHLDRWTALRQAHAQEYRQRLEARPELVLPAVHPASTRHVFNQFTVRARDRDGLRAFLQERGVGTGVYYPVPLHRQACFAEVGSGVHLPETDRAAAEVLSLPMYPELQADQRAWVAASIAAFYER
jgi:dTDP-4-amino-4,6-dideoxygalactose transaminase